MKALDPVLDARRITQRDEALGKAREQQRLNAQLRETVRTTRAREARGIVAHVFSDDFERFGSMRVEQLLGCLPTWGPAKVARACEAADVNPVALVRELSPGRREALSELLKDSDSDV